MQERGNGRYVFTLWLGTGPPPHTGGCETFLNQAATWANRLTVTLTGMDTASPSASVAEDGFTATVSID